MQATFLESTITIKTRKPSFHMLAHDRRIAENTASDRQRLHGNTLQRSGDRQRSYEN